MITTRNTPTAAPATGIVERMADKMREMGQNGIAVTIDTMAEHSDFTRAEIKEFGPAAADHAKQHHVRQVAA